MFYSVTQKKSWRKGGNAKEGEKERSVCSVCAVLDGVEDGSWKGIRIYGDENIVRGCYRAREVRDRQRKDEKKRKKKDRE